jgi:hypothetical protein
MGVSTHPVDSTMVISLWQGDVCTGTFRLPAHDAARLISTLAYGMTEAIPGGNPCVRVERSRFRQIWSELPRRLYARLKAEKDSHLRLVK